MPGKKLTLLICLSLAGLILVSVGFTFWAKANRATLKDVAIGTAAWRIRIAKNFNYDKQGHFGAQTQYLSKDVDSQNGKYCIQCKQGKVSAIFVKYTPPISREESLRAVARLVGEGSVNIFDDSSEIDLAALSFMKSQKPAGLEAAEDHSLKPADGSVIGSVVDSAKPAIDAVKIDAHKSVQSSQANKPKSFCPPSEYIYYTHDRAAELQFVGPNDDRVTDLMVWAQS